MDDSPSVAEELACALIVTLLRRGVLTPRDVEEMAAGLPEEAAHLAQALILESETPTAIEPKPVLRVVD